jgi:hypothetical protein
MVCELTPPCVGPILTLNSSDSSYIPSSQGEEIASDEGIRKQLKIYRSAEGSANDVQIHKWVEKRRLLPGECETTDFHHLL